MVLEVRSWYGVTIKTITGQFISYYPVLCFPRSPCMWTFLVPAIQTQLSQPPFRKDTSPGTEPTWWGDWPSTPLISWVWCWRMGSCRWMKREPSCCPLRYELPSLESKTLPAVLYICWASLVQKTDLERLAGARLISLVFLLLMFPAHTNTIFVSWVLP